MLKTLALAVFLLTGLVGMVGCAVTPPEPQGPGIAALADSGAGVNPAPGGVTGAIVEHIQEKAAPSQKVRRKTPLKKHRKNLH